MDLAIVDTTALTMRGERLGIVEDAAVGVRDGEIAYVGPTAAFDADPDRTIDGRDRLTMPGFVDVHAHTSHTLVRGGAQDVPEIEWMNRALSPLAAATTAGDRVAGARLSAVELLRSGVTTVGEYAEDVAELTERALLPAGLRVAATETINAVAAEGVDRGPDDPYPLDDDAADAGLRRAEALFDEYADHDRVHPLYGPQALDMVPPDLLETVHERAVEHDRSLHVHVAQGDRERRQIEARYGADETTVSVLEDLGVADEHLLATHLHGATAEERARLADAGVRMAGCPSSIAGIDGETPPVAEYRAAGGTVGIGTDQAPGAGGHDFLRELRTAAMLSKTARSDPTALPAHVALRIGTIEGARALGIDDRAGSLEVGKRADLVTVALDHHSVAPTVDEPLHTTVPNLVYGGGDVVDTVVVDGEVVVDGGAVRTLDVEAIVDEARERAERIFADAAADWRAADSALVDAVDDGWL
jgi:5-methylthioadenosine/S-adenosylhomocysteine deaminase